MTVKERVQAGAELLDAEHPGWASKINLETLDVGRWWACVIGQLQESDSSIDTELSGNSQFGFTAQFTAQEHPDEFDELNAAWKTLIQERTAT